MERPGGILRNLIDPTRIEYGVASSVVIGAVNLVDPARLSLGRLVAFRCLTAAVTSVLVLIELRRVKSFEADPVAKAGVAVGVAGTVFGLSEVSEKLDARIIGGLRRAGVRRPRVLLAVASTLTSIAAFRAGEQQSSESLYEWRATRDDDAADGPRYGDIDPALRDLIDAILTETTGHAAETLRVQWASAQAEYEPEDTGAFSPGLRVRVDGTAPKVVPYDFRFPVKAQFTAPSGFLAQVSVGISDGRLRSVWIEVVQSSNEPESFDFDAPDPLNELTGWPAVDQVEFILDTP